MKRETLIALSLALLACGGTTQTTTSSEPAPSPTAASAAATPTGPLAVDDGITRVVIYAMRVGGCDPRTRGVEYWRKTRTLTSPGCLTADAPIAGSVDYPTVERVLDEAAAKRVEDALRTITYIEHPPCEAYEGRKIIMWTENDARERVDYVAPKCACYGATSEFRLAPATTDVYELLRSMLGV